MTKEQLSEQYAEGKSSSSVFQEAHKRDFLAGFEAWQPKWISVEEQTPPKDTQLLIKSPDTGVIYLSYWREYYNIFSCQSKTERSNNWSWMGIPQ